MSRDLPELSELAVEGTPSYSCPEHRGGEDREGRALGVEEAAGLAAPE